MSDSRRLAGAVIGIIGLGAIAFGAIRGASQTGPAHGTRLIVAIAPPVDANAAAMALEVTRARLGEHGTTTRASLAGDHLIVEVPDNVDETAAMIERTAKLEVRANGAVVLTGEAIHHAEVVSGGVAIDCDASKIAATMKLTFVLDGKPHGEYAADLANATQLHVVTPDVKTASDLVDVIQTGAMHPLHVEHREAFTRATGFLPRALPFFGVGGVLLIIGALMALLHAHRDDEARA